VPETRFGCRYSGDLVSIPKQIRSFAGLDSKQPRQMANISLKSFLADLLRRSCLSICGPKRDSPVSLIGNHPLLALASPSGQSLTARRSRSFSEMSHGLS